MLKIKKAKFKKMHIGFLLFALIMIFASFYHTALADPITDPTHFDDTYWYFPTNSNGYTQISSDVTPIVDGSPDGYYFSSYFLLANNPGGFGGYLGLQTEGTEPTGKIAIFSIWGATASSGPGYNGSGTESGQTYYTSRIQYQWVVNNTYITNVYLAGQSGGSETWTATVTDQNTGVQSLIGSITTPSSYGNLQNELVTFHERYSGPTTSCSDMQESEVEFTNIKANGSVAPNSQTNIEPSDSACAGDFATQNIPGGIETIIGGQFPYVAPAPVVKSATVKKVTVVTKPPPDTTPPTDPTNLIASTISNHQINLSWDASTDNVGVTGYYIYRSTSNTIVSKIATIATTSYNDSALASSTQYTYYTEAFDAAGNASPPSTSITTYTQAPLPSITQLSQLVSGKNTILPEQNNGIISMVKSPFEDLWNKFDNLVHEL